MCVRSYVIASLEHLISRCLSIVIFVPVSVPLCALSLCCVSAGFRLCGLRSVHRSVAWCALCVSLAHSQNPMCEVRQHRNQAKLCGVYDLVFFLHQGLFTRVE